ncbi:MAG: electron transfer flavoprotein subunit alpha/FixB family protein [Pseudomonadales bacterium]|jgi:electron transfer flavoprotein alpha subunit|nr:electron transfer flavoprotein subunit alpha/FixB family protein [Pseudomonadales bacterium]MDP7360215.1 electron transfer flavoprotein subunit alpha/FixB family protein [Pseudomonadales bacterium]MDP7596741.1 electron transfer flavoprotein subunit alpha/FixB family protein [Pseudomonadales bacterium]HJN50293.1 electron transfer flavoprotein subunit alpha/FixB family protein [Pseudomonadales bacterium]|tara:strand:+ start:1390 stop:2403 length:1014 start_codon:yes stop_codon:yes gene_type:complete
MSDKKQVMVFIEQSEKKIGAVSLELICEAGRLAKKLSAEVVGVALGYGIGEELAALGHYGCKTVYYVEDERLSHFTSNPYAKSVVSIIRKQQPEIVLFGATTTGRDMAPRIASALKCGLTADCTELQIGEYKSKGELFENAFLQMRPAFGGNIMATIVSPESFPSMATVRPGVMQLDTPDASRTAEVLVEESDLSDEDFLTEVIEVVRREKTVNLSVAQIIVAAGAGAADPETLALVRKLAVTIGAELAASRPLVDAGLLSHDHQVGQTGTTVRPNLYIACGISGQIQHRAGMVESQRIIAINSDPDAPIFRIAHYGIVGDLNAVIPKMIAAYKEKA